MGSHLWSGHAGLCQSVERYRNKPLWVDRRVSLCGSLGDMDLVSICRYDSQVRCEVANVYDVAPTILLPTFSFIGALLQLCAQTTDDFAAGGITFVVVDAFLLFRGKNDQVDISREL